ncbi:hypothetical protein H131_05863 [Lysinibacillus sphaericus OT4b.31]|uniref:Uncharacterized protein n=1 Tax=Lysinibacillus sphaericus OT4b.31 TaxID=1285586 RepID=R7ZHA3_LYSSH|nr:hypothetical protein H131_05863 [Lysinibacillus sphaericus OT4b.31]
MANSCEGTTQDIKTLITSGTIIVAVALYMIFGRTPAKIRILLLLSNKALLQLKRLKKRPEMIALM